MWIKIPEAAERLGVSVPTLRKSIKDATLEGVRTIKVGVSTMLCAEDITLSDHADSVPARDVKQDRRESETQED